MTELERTHTSLELSKKLAENGFKNESSIFWTSDGVEWSLTTKEQLEKIDPYYPEFNFKKSLEEGGELFSAYDILNDLCCRYAKEMFGKAKAKNIDKCRPGEKIIQRGRRWVAHDVIDLSQDGKKQEAEDYLWEHCLFNPTNAKD